MARKLKVYRTDAGFYETVVAASNQAEALKVWGVRQNLFAEGAAEVVTDEATVKAAIATPGEPLRRPIGSNEPFALKPSRPDTLKGGKKAKPKPNRKALDAAEAELKVLDERRTDDEAEFDRRQAALDEERRDAETVWDRGRTAAKKAVADARRAFEKAGGE